MKRTLVILALMGFFGCPLYASVVTIDITVNDSTSPVTINLGETVLVSIYATVSDNNYQGVDLGLAGYGVDILTTDDRLDPNEGWDGYGWDQQWDVTWAVPALSIRARGNTDNPAHDDDVMGHGAALAEFIVANRDIAVTRTLLASGYFQGVFTGKTNIELGGEVAANVVWYDDGYKAVPADTIVLGSAVEVTVVADWGFCGDPEHPYPVGDLNHDCRVDFRDFAILALHWLECTIPED